MRKFVCLLISFFAFMLFWSPPTKAIAVKNDVTFTIKAQLAGETVMNVYYVSCIQFAQILLNDSIIELTGSFNSTANNRIREIYKPDEFNLISVIPININKLRQNPNLSFREIYTHSSGGLEDWQS